MPATSNREDRVYESAYGSLRQILNAHIAVEIGIFSIEIGQHIFDPQVEIVRALKFRQPTQ